MPEFTRLDGHPRYIALSDTRLSQVGQRWERILNDVLKVYFKLRSRCTPWLTPWGQVQKHSFGMAGIWVENRTGHPRNTALRKSPLHYPTRHRYLDGWWQALSMFLDLSPFCTQPLNSPKQTQIFTVRPGRNVKRYFILKWIAKKNKFFVPGNTFSGILLTKSTVAEIWNQAWSGTVQRWEGDEDGDEGGGGGGGGGGGAISTDLRTWWVWLVSFMPPAALTRRDEPAVLNEEQDRWFWYYSASQRLQ